MQFQPPSLSSWGPPDPNQPQSFPQPSYLQPQFYQTLTPSQQLPQTPIPSAQPPRKRMSRSNKIALAAIISLIAVFILIVAIVEAQPGAAQLSTADQNATVQANDIAATNVAEQNATSIANSSTQLSADLTAQAMTPTPVPTTPVISTGVGSSQSSGPWNLTVNSIKLTVSDNQFEVPKSGDEYIDINFTALNTDSRPQDMNIFDFTLRDDSGTPYTPTLIDTAHDPTGTVLSGQKIRGDLVFEIPKSVHSVLLQFDPPSDFDNSQVVQWNLTV